MKKTPVFHPFAFAAYPALFLFSHNIGSLSFNEITSPLAVSLILSIGLWIVMYVFIRDYHKSGFIVTLFLLLFFSYGHFSKYLTTIYLLWPAVFVMGILVAFKVKNPFKNVTLVFNIIAVVMIAFPLYSIAAFKFSNRTVKAPYDYSQDFAREGGVDAHGKALPNIYYIILDAYAGTSILSELYNFDNSEYINKLRQKGFIIQDRSFSNYSKTFLTVASSFNMDYIHSFLGKQLPSNVYEKKQFWGLIRNNKAFRFLKKRGYSVIAFSSGHIDTELKNADVYLSPGLNFSEFQNMVINTTPIPPFLKLFNLDDQFDLQRKRINSIFDKLSKLKKSKEPFIVFAHIMAPHPPFVFGAHGEPHNPEEIFTDHDGDWLIRKGRLSRSRYIKGYTDQLTYINSRMLEAVDKIISQSATPPIIIITGDHGPRSMCIWSNPYKTYMRECMSVTKAYYLPDCEECLHYEELSLVNIFRVLFNHYFGTHYDLLKDENYYQFETKKGFAFMKLSDSILQPNQELIRYHKERDLANAR